MKLNFELRYSAHPKDFKHYKTGRIREDFLINNCFEPETVNMVYSLYDRMLIAYAKPVEEVLSLLQIPFFETDYFQQKRETGIINVGGDGEVILDGKPFILSSEDAIYIGKGVKEVKFRSIRKESPALHQFMFGT